MKKQSFVLGALILTISSLVCKVLGAIYKIPLANVLGTQGIGVYYLVFPIYAFLITFVSSSFTISISKSVSSAVAKDDYYYANRVFKASIILLSIVGFSLSVLLCLLCRAISSLQGLDNAYVCYLIISPSVLFVGIGSAFRGYFQGLRNMLPSAISQVIGQLVKLSVGFLLATLLSHKGVMWGTAGAIVGVSIAEMLTCAYFVIYYFIFKKHNKKYFCYTQKNQNQKLLPIIKSVLKQAIPFTLSSIILPMSLVIDSFLIINILKSMGFEKFFATGLLGLSSGVVNTLVNLPSTLSIAICITIVPYISFALSKNNLKEVQDKANFAIKLSMLIAIPCCLVFLLFSSQIIKTLYAGSMNNIYEFNVASSLLTVSSINVLYLSLLQITTSLLQAINKAYIPVISLAVSLIFKVIFEVILINNPYLNISGAVISNSVCYFVSSLINIISFRRSFQLNCSFFKCMISPLLSSCAMSLAIFVTIQILQNYISQIMCIVLSFIIGIIVYVFFVLMLKTFTKEERNALFIFKAKRKNDF